MSVKTAQGTNAWANGADTVDFALPLVPSNFTLTNALQADGFFNADSGYMWKVDLRPFRYVKLTGRVPTVSASANNPRLQLRYSASYSTVIGNFAQLGASSVEISMFTGATFQDSGWIEIVPAARIDNCFLALANIGGDGAADPVVNQVVAYFK